MEDWGHDTADLVDGSLALCDWSGGVGGAESGKAEEEKGGQHGGDWKRG